MLRIEFPTCYIFYIFSARLLRVDVYTYFVFTHFEAAKAFDEDVHVSERERERGKD